MHSAAFISPIILRGRLKGPQIARLQGLLNMLYTPKELADTIGFSRRQVYRVYMHLGCPFQRDASGHVWINGAEFRDWVRRTYTKPTMAENESFCLTCREPVAIVDAHLESRGDISYLISSCPKCGRRLTRILKNRRRKNLD